MKYCIKTTGGQYPILEKEIKAVLEAMEKKKIVVLQTGIFNGAFISEIVRDIHGERGWDYGYKIQGGDRISWESYKTELPERVGELLKSSDVKLIENK